MKNKAFTLIELLAVIAILAIILLIAVPKIVNVIENTKIGAFKANAQMLIRAIDLKNAEKELDYTELRIGTLKEKLGLDDSNYEALTVSKLNGNTYIDIIGKNKWEGLVAKGTSGNIEITKGTTSVVSTDPSGASNPDIASNMIPIYYDEPSSTWKKADITNLNESYKWYDYTTKKWANAVTVTENARNSYQDALLGTTVLETDILTYMVWVPRYKYRIPVGTGARTIDIVFESSTTNISNGNAITSYLTHPGFAFGTKKVNGIWVAKYELTNTINNITVKPNLTSLRDYNVSSFFTAIRNMESTNNIYGYVENEVDTHMIKNDEWGAVAYLANSIYGKNSEVTINESNTYITGLPGPEASTTGNIYGIYDMSGCAVEYVMGNLNNLSGESLEYNSGFSGLSYWDESIEGIPFPATKYYNLYTSQDPLTACAGNICLGHTLSETQTWYDDDDYVSNESSTWIERGGGFNFGSYAGLYYFNFAFGSAGDDATTRLCQTKE